MEANGNDRRAVGDAAGVGVVPLNLGGPMDTQGQKVADIMVLSFVVLLPFFFFFFNKVKASSFKLLVKMSKAARPGSARGLCGWWMTASEH